MTKRKHFEVPFRCGDRVQYIGSDVIWKRVLNSRKGSMIIHECIPKADGKHEYSTCSGAWFDHADLTLLEPASRMTIQILCNRLESDLEEEIAEDRSVKRQLLLES